MPRRASQARVSRVSSVALAATLLVISLWGVVSSNRMNAAIHEAGRSAQAADAMQNLRYLVAQETGDVHDYLTAPDTVPAAQVQSASESVHAALVEAGSLAGTNGSRGLASYTVLVDAHRRYASAVEQALTLVGRGSEGAAAQMSRTELDPLARQMSLSLGGLASEAHSSAAEQMRQVTTTSDFLHVATPAVIALSLVAVLFATAVGRRYRRTIERQSMHDPLTGLPNRLLFSDRARQALVAAARTGSRPVVLVLDLDGFKEVNDTLGHHMGDQLLEQTARLLGSVSRPGDTVARLGGDEFALLLLDGGPEVGREVAGRILAALQDPFVLDGVKVGMEASIGVAAQIDPVGRGLAESELDAQVVTLLQEADGAMFTAKAERVGFVVHERGDDRPATDRLAALGELRRALDQDELVVHFQPKIGTDFGRIVGVEALVRWQHPTRGLLQPREFIPLAESTTLVHRLTAVVLAKALALCREWLDAGVQLPVSVNTSARCLMDPGFPGSVADQLAAAGVPAHLLCLELTESVIMRDPALALAAMQELASAGHPAVRRRFRDRVLLDGLPQPSCPSTS